MIAALGQIAANTRLGRDSFLHLLQQVVVHVDDHLRQEDVLERPRPGRGDAVLGDEPAGREDISTTRSARKTASRTLWVTNTNVFRVSSHTDCSSRWRISRD